MTKIVIAIDDPDCKSAYNAQQIDELVADGYKPRDAQRIVWSAPRHVLVGDQQLETEVGTIRVRDVLDAPQHFAKKKLVDPFFKRKDDDSKAKVYLDYQGMPWVLSRAYGGRKYTLRYEVKAVLQEAVDQRQRRSTQGDQATDGAVPC
jgi:hypothetical protein